MRALWLPALVAVAAALAFWSGLRRDLVDPRPSKLLLDRRGQYLGEVPGEGEALGYWPLPYELPEKIARATLETEDRYFWQHSGVRPQSIARAVWQNARNRQVISGASTLAMQVARLQSPGSRNVFRKFKEMCEARLLIGNHGHEQVLRQYLLLAPYGNNVHGAARAARLYFDKPLEDLSWLQAAFLAAIPQMPGRMNPYEPAGLRRATRRAQRILRMLQARGVIADEELRQALGSDLKLVPKPRREPAALHAVLAWAERLKARSEPISIATLDLEMEMRVAAVLRDNLARLGERNAGTSAAMVVELPAGNVLAYVGSHDYFAAEQRGAIDYARVKRSPGSALKPFIYGLALERGRFTAATELPDMPVEFPAGLGRAYLPENVNHTFQGPMLLREALANSRNIPALEVLSDVGIEPVLRLLERGGVEGISFEPGRYGLGLAIGSLPVTLEEVTALYTALANGGQTLPLRRFEDEAPVSSQRLMGREAAQLVTHILSDGLARQPSFSPGGPLEFDYAVAAKTGTSQGHRDSWAIGYSDRLLVAVWVGNHDARRMDRVTGAAGAGEALHRIMEALMPQVAPHRSVLSNFPPPDGAVEASICPLSGRLAGPECPRRKVEYFVAGTEPFEGCPWHALVRIDRRNGLRASASCPERFVETRSMLDLPETYANWAARERVEVAPRQASPLCPAEDRATPPSVVITEPRSGSRYLWDPDTPAESAAIRLAARVQPADEEIVWVVDGVPVARVGWPHATRWPLRPGRHLVEAKMVRRPESSRPVVVVVED